MECNKEEAARCKAISEAHFERHDLVGATKYAQKAKLLFPGLEGLSQLSAILDVHFAAHYKLATGDSNCYGILQVGFRADDDTIRKQYRKLALALHPDKNKAFGAEAAFKHISEAWSVLSDREKKLSFDKRLLAHRSFQGSFPNLHTFHNAHVAHTSKASIVNQGQTHVHSQHGQCKSSVQQQGHGQSHAQQQQQGHVCAYSQHRQGQTSVRPRPQGQLQASIPRPQGQGHEHSQNGQGKASVPRPHGHAYAYPQQGEGQGQGHEHSQNGQGQASVPRPHGHAYAYPQQGQGQAHGPALQGQGSAHVFQQPLRDQTCVPDQGGQSQGYTHQQQGQGAMHSQGQTHEAPIARKNHGPEHQVQGQVPVHHQVQGPAHAHQQVHAHQQGQGQAVGCQQQGQGQAYPPQQQVKDQPCAPEQHGQSQGHVHHSEASAHQGQGQRQPHANEQQIQSQVHAQDQHGKEPGHVHLQHRQDSMQNQGHAYQTPAPQKEDHALGHQVQGQVHVLQGQGPVHTNQQVHANHCAHAQQQHGQSQTQAQGEAHQARVSQNNQAQVNKPSQPAFRHSKSTFWTACPFCRMQIEYERVHMNKNLCCPMCYKAFVSREITPVQGPVIWPPPILRFKPDAKTDAGIKRGLFDSNLHCNQGADSTLPARVQSNKKAKISTEDSLFRQHGHQKPQEVPAPPVQKPVDLQQKGLGKLEKDKLKRMVALHTKAGLERLIARSKGVIAKKLAEERERKVAADKASAVGENQKAEDERSASASEPFVQSKPAAGKEGYVNKAEEKATNSRLSTCNLTKLQKESRVLQKDSGLFKVETLQRKRKLASPVDKSLINRSEGTLNLVKDLKSYGGFKGREVSDECSVQVNDAEGLADKCRMEVPDPDFHSFDGDRTEGHFASGQIWASYDDDDGMPRYYSRVHKILSRRPLKMQMNWLEACSPSDETLAWLCAGFQHSCGDFILGSVYLAEEVSTFSHLVATDRGPKGVFKIYPRQGDVWAVYRDWETLKVKEDKQGYDMVEIVAPFVEGKGVQVSPLFKVAGFKTVFERKAGEDNVTWVHPQELRRLSHQVPAHCIMAGEVPSIQVDCLELDPASTPMDLIYGKQEL